MDGVSSSEASFVGFDDMTQGMGIEETIDGKEMASKYLGVERVLEMVEFEFRRNCSDGGSHAHREDVQAWREA